MRDLAPREPRSSGSCLRGAACVRQGQQTRLLQNLFKDWWKPLRRLPGEVPADEERAQPSGASSRPPSLPPSIPPCLPPPPPAIARSRPRRCLTPGQRARGPLAHAWHCRVRSVNSVPGLAGLQHILIPAALSRWERSRWQGLNTTRPTRRDVVPLAKRSLWRSPVCRPAFFTHASPGTGAGRSRAAGGRQRWGLLPWGHDMPWGHAVGACFYCCPAAPSSAPARCLPGGGGQRQRVSRCEAESRGRFSSRSRACVWTSVTRGGRISLGGTEGPGEPDSTRLSLTKDEK